MVLRVLRGVCRLRPPSGVFVRCFRQGVRPEETGGMIQALCGAALIGGAGAGIGFMGYQHYEEMENWQCEALSQCPCEFKNICPLPEIPAPPRSSWTDLPVRPCVCAKETCLICRCRSPCEWEELLAEEAKREKERKLGFKMLRLYCWGVGLMGGDAEEAASRLIPDVTRKAPSFAPPPDAVSIGWMEGAWEKFKSTKSLKMETETDAEAQPPKGAQTQAVKRSPPPEERPPTPEPPSSRKDPSGVAGGAGETSSEKIEYYQHQPTYLPSAYFTYPETYSTPKREESPPPVSHSQPRESADQGPPTSYFKRNSSPGSSGHQLMDENSTSSPWRYFSSKQQQSQPYSDSQPQQQAAPTPAAAPKPAAATNTRAPSFAPESSWGQQASLAPASKCPQPKNEPQSFGECPQKPLFPPVIPSRPSCDRVESLPPIPPPPPCVELPPPPPPPPPPPVPFPIVENAPPRLPMSPMFAAELPIPPGIPAESHDGAGRPPCLPPKLLPASMVKCEDVESNKCRNSDGGRSNNNDLGADDESAAAGSFIVGQIPAVPALPHLPPPPAPLQPMVAPSFYATTPEAAIEEETGNAQELAPSIRRGLIDVTPEETRGIADSEGNPDADAKKVRRKRRRRRKISPPENENNNNINLEAATDTITNLEVSNNLEIRNTETILENNTSDINTNLENTINLENVQIIDPSKTPDKKINV